MEQVKLRKCPFCGKDVADYASCMEMRVCADFRKCEEGQYVCVVCSFARGGCVASTGFFPTREEAEEAWNMRDEPFVVMEGPEIGQTVSVDAIMRLAERCARGPVRPSGRPSASRQADACPSPEHAPERVAQAKNGGPA